MIHHLFPCISASVKYVEIHETKTFFKFNPIVTLSEILSFFFWSRLCTFIDSINTRFMEFHHDTRIQRSRFNFSILSNTICIKMYLLLRIFRLKKWHWKPSPEKLAFLKKRNNQWMLLRQSVNFFSLKNCCHLAVISRVYLLKWRHWPKARRPSLPLLRTNPWGCNA